MRASHKRISSVITIMGKSQKKGSVIKFWVLKVTSSPRKHKSVTHSLRQPRRTKQNQPMRFSHPLTTPRMPKRMVEELVLWVTVCRM